MLKDDGFEAISNLTCLPLDPEDSKYVSILSDNFVGLDGVVVELAVVNELELGLRMSTVCHCQQNSQYEQLNLHSYEL